MVKLTRENIIQMVRMGRWGTVDNFSSSTELWPDLWGMNQQKQTSAQIFLLDFTSEDFSGLNLSNLDLSMINFSGANFTKTDLRGTSFRKSNLSSTNLRNTDLRESILSEANLNKANLIGANLNGADLWETNFSVAKIIRSDFSEANLSKAYFSMTYLGETNLHKANFSKSRLAGTLLVGLDLRQPLGLETMEHFGPSYISTNTLENSQGQIPVEFLRGCGLNNWEIENIKLYNQSLYLEQFTLITYQLHQLRFGDAIKYNSCFISYSNQDARFAQKLYDNLQEKGVRCWFAPEDMKIGDKMHDVIDQSIRLQDRLLIILSKSSINSQWVEREVRHALELEEERKEKVLFPIRLDETVMNLKTGWGAMLKRDRHIGDFCDWQDEVAYKAGFERLLKDLRA